LCALVGALLAGREPLARLADGAFEGDRRAFLLWSVAALGGAILLAMLGAFVVSAEDARFLSVVPRSGFFSHHYCYTAYREAAAFAGASEPNVYAPALYGSPRGGRVLDGFSVDQYYYPPTFLLLPELVRLAARDFLHERMVWYALGFSSITLAITLTARFVGGREGRIAALLGIVVFLAVPGRLALQSGNFQAIAVAWTVLAMLAFERGRPAIGGALLAFTMLGKLYPGVMLAYLVGQRRWRDALWTAAWCVIYTALVLLRWGRAPFVAFFGFTLPRLASGEAFPMLRSFPWTVTINQSAYGVVLKLRMAGLAWATFQAASVVAWVYTGAVVLGALHLGRLALPRAERAQVWLALVGLAAMRSPFLPIGYALFAPLWLLTMLGGTLAGRRRALGAAALALAFGALCALIPPEAFAARGPSTALLVGALPQLATLLLYGWALVSAHRAVLTERP
jgi:hypothetical protein